LDIPLKNSPDELLAKVIAEEKENSRGRLKIYLGMCAGVGKTYAMLNDALIERKRGLDVVAGYIEPHGRAETETLAAELEALPFQTLSHRDTNLREFDLDAALKRRPQILLVDELAHTNATGSRHQKRWQDIQELLREGINVYTTLNIQHLESLNDVIAGITGIAVHETVPDSVLAQASSIEVVDIPPEELLQRLEEGKVYGTEKVQTALKNFFRKGNLIALRELVLRLTAERVDAQMRRYRDDHYVKDVWPIASRILVCVAPNAMSSRVVRAAARMASSTHGELIAISVESPRYANLSERQRQQAAHSLKLAETFGAETIVRTAPDPANAILSIARERNISSIVIGKPVRPRWREILSGSVVDRIIENSRGVSVHVIPSGQAEALPERPASLAENSFTLRGVFFVVLITALCTGVSQLMFPYFELANLIMVYILGVTWLASQLSKAEAIFAAVASVAAFDFFFVPTRFSFGISDMQYIITFLVMLIVGLFISTLTSRIRAQAQIVSDRENRTAAMFDLTRRLANAQDYEAIASIVALKIRDIFPAATALLLLENDQTLHTVLPTTSKFEEDPQEKSVAHWVATKKLPAGKGTDTLPNSRGHYLPLMSGEECVGVLAVEFAERPLLKTEEELLNAYCAQVALVIARIRVGHQSEAAKLETEREKFRNTLLSSVSHDLRTPLTSISGAVSTLIHRNELPEKNRQELLLTVSEQVQHLARIVRNVLDITRVDSPSIKLNLEWNSLEELVGSAITRTDSQLSGREVTVRHAPHLPLLSLDATLVEQVIVNVLENAAKHTPPGTPIEITSQRDQGLVFLTIDDHGPGIALGDRERIFEKLYRRNGKGQEGFGLGLAICKGVMLAHGGDITVTERKGGGSSFAMRFPANIEAPKVPHE